MLVFHAPLTSLPAEDVVGGVEITADSTPSIVTAYGVKWTELESNILSIGASDASTLLTPPFTIGIWACFKEIPNQQGIAHLIRWLNEDPLELSFETDITLFDGQLNMYAHGGGQLDHVWIDNSPINLDRPVFVAISWSDSDELAIQVANKRSTLPQELPSIDVPLRLFGGYQVFFGEFLSATARYRHWMIWDEVLSQPEIGNIHRQGVWQTPTVRTVCNPGII